MTDPHVPCDGQQGRYLTRFDGMRIVAVRLQANREVSNQIELYQMIQGGFYAEQTCDVNCS